MKHAGIIGSSGRAKPPLDVAYFILWLFIVSSVMFFAALTSAYLVKRSAGPWMSFSLPIAFGYTAVLSVVSSVSAHLTLLSAKKNSIRSLQAHTLITLLLGALFLTGQYRGWQALVSNHIYLVGNASGSFVYVVSGAHALHALVGMLLFLMVGKRVFWDGYNIKSEKLVRMSAIYWHFVGILWVYLYSFFSVVR